MALTKIKLNTMVTGTLPDANIPDDITIDTAAAAPANALTGNTLASGVTASSLTSVGTLTGLASSGTIVLGDLDIIPTSSNVSVIKHDSGSGSLTLQGDQVNIKNRAGDETGLSYNDGGGVTFGGNITQSKAGNLRLTQTATGNGESSIVLTANNSTGDSFVRWETNSTTFCLGIDNSDGDKFILSAGSDPHSDSVINIQPGGSSIAIDKPASFTDVIVGKTNSHISYSSGQGTDTVTGGAFRASGSDIVTGRLFIQGYQNTGNDLIGFNNETNQLVLYNYTDNAYLMKIAHGATLSVDIGSSMVNLYNNDTGSAAVSYTHLTLPTILLV